MIEPSLKIDSLGKNIMYTGIDARIRQLYNLTLMKPGSDPLNPDKGCDARSYYYQFKDDNVLSTLESKIYDQVSKYTPHIIQSVNCKAIRNRSGKWILHIIYVLVSGSQAIVSTDEERSALNLISR